MTTGEYGGNSLSKATVIVPSGKRPLDWGTGTSDWKPPSSATTVGSTVGAGARFKTRAVGAGVAAGSRIGTSVACAAATAGASVGTEMAESSTSDCRMG